MVAAMRSRASRISPSAIGRTGSGVVDIVHCPVRIVHQGGGRNVFNGDPDRLEERGLTGAAATRLDTGDNLADLPHNLSCRHHITRFPSRRLAGLDVETSSGQELVVKLSPVRPHG